MAEHLGAAIRDARGRAHMSQQQLAEAVGVSARTVGNWERGQTFPGALMGRIVEVLGPLVPSSQEGVGASPIMDFLRRRQPAMANLSDPATPTQVGERPGLDFAYRFRDEWARRLHEAQARRDVAASEASYAEQALAIAERDLRALEAAYDVQVEGGSVDEVEEAAGRSAFGEDYVQVQSQGGQSPSQRMAAKHFDEADRQKAGPRE